ncbi:hypothetical protein GGR53DRAFT_515308 [Hypoxylon sp. FL1150]|nr:hypothetical protein GGR53DRAFT_515308 [Hypoxylon sp. FL1150]
MAPVTRRSRRIAEAKGQDESIISTTSDAVNTAPPKEESAPAASSPRGKRKSIEHATNDENDGGSPNLDSPLTSPKRQRLAVRTREDESTPTGGRKTHLEVEIPVTAISTVPRSDPVPDSQDEDEEGSAVGKPEVEPTSASKQLEEDAIHRLASQSLEPEQTPMAKPKSIPEAKGKHITFGDDDDVNQFVTTAAAVPAKSQEDADDDEGSDDDEAPEAVSTQAVAKKMQEAAHAASEAADKQAASLKRKRQEKDSMYKQQAEQRRKRVRGVELHQSSASAPAATERASSTSSSAEVEKAVTTGRRQRAEKFSLPAVLPAEFLTDSSDEDEDDDTTSRLVKKPKKINFEDNENKRPRDKTVGATRYRVLAKQGDEALAPRARKSARVSKESLLKRRRAAVAPGTKKGFLVKR